MASYEVDGLVLPLTVADHPALNFGNTRAGWGAPAPKEYLRSYAHLVVWARENGRLPAAAASRLRRQDGEAAAAVLARALALRSALYAVLLGRARPGDWATVNAEVRAAGAVSALTPTRPATWTLPATSIVDSPLWSIAWSAAELLTSPAATQVSACPGEGCGWLFADPRGRRRWCSMAWCGNRNKARRHAARRAGGQAEGRRRT